METIIGSDMEMSSRPTGIVPILFSFCKSIVLSFKINNNLLYREIRRTSIRQSDEMRPLSTRISDSTIFLQTP